MQPLGRQKFKALGTKGFPGKGEKWWWEDIPTECKKRSMAQAKKEIKEEVALYHANQKKTI